MDEILRERSSSDIDEQQHDMAAKQHQPTRNFPDQSESSPNTIGQASTNEKQSPNLDDRDNHHHHFKDKDPTDNINPMDIIVTSKDNMIVKDSLGAHFSDFNQNNEPQEDSDEFYHQLQQCMRTESFDVPNGKKNGFPHTVEECMNGIPYPITGVIRNQDSFDTNLIKDNNEIAELMKSSLEGNEFHSAHHASSMHDDKNYSISPEAGAEPSIINKDIVLTDDTVVTEANNLGNGGRNKEENQHDHHGTTFDYSQVQMMHEESRESQQPPLHFEPLALDQSLFLGSPGTDHATHMLSSNETGTDKGSYYNQSGDISMEVSPAVSLQESGRSPIGVSEHDHTNVGESPVIVKQEMSQPNLQAPEPELLSDPDPQSDSDAQPNLNVIGGYFHNEPVITSTMFASNESGDGATVPFDVPADPTKPSEPHPEPEALPEPVDVCNDDDEIVCKIIAYDTTGLCHYEDVVDDLTASEPASARGQPLHRRDEPQQQFDLNRNEIIENDFSPDLDVIKSRVPENEIPTIEICHDIVADNVLASPLEDQHEKAHHSVADFDMEKASAQISSDENVKKLHEEAMLEASRFSEEREQAILQAETSALVESTGFHILADVREPGQKSEPFDMGMPEVLLETEPVGQHVETIEHATTKEEMKVLAGADQKIADEIFLQDELVSADLVVPPSKVEDEENLAAADEKNPHQYEADVTEPGPAEEMMMKEEIKLGEEPFEAEALHETMKHHEESIAVPPQAEIPSVDSKVENSKAEDKINLAQFLQSESKPLEPAITPSNSPMSPSAHLPVEENLAAAAVSPNEAIVPVSLKDVVPLSPRELAPLPQEDVALLSPKELAPLSPKDVVPSALLSADSAMEAIPAQLAPAEHKTLNQQNHTEERPVDLLPTESIAEKQHETYTEPKVEDDKKIVYKSTMPSLSCEPSNDFPSAVEETKPEAIDKQLNAFDEVPQAAAELSHKLTETLTVAELAEDSVSSAELSPQLEEVLAAPAELASAAAPKNKKSDISEVVASKTEDTKKMGTTDSAVPKDKLQPNKDRSAKIKATPEPAKLAPAVHHEKMSTTSVTPKTAATKVLSPRPAATSANQQHKTPAAASTMSAKPSTPVSAASAKPNATAASAKMEKTPASKVSQNLSRRTQSHSPSRDIADVTARLSRPKKSTPAAAGADSSSATAAGSHVSSGERRKQHDEYWKKKKSAQDEKLAIDKEQRRKDAEAAFQNWLQRKEMERRRARSTGRPSNTNADNKKLEHKRSTPTSASQSHHQFTPRAGKKEDFV